MDKIREMKLVHSEGRRGKPGLIKLAKGKLKKSAAYKYTVVEDGEGRASAKENYLCLRTALARAQMYINWLRINSAWKLEDCF